MELEFDQGGILGVREDLVGVDHADDAVESDPVPEVGIVERDEDPGGIGDATGFEQDVFDGFWAGEQRGDRLDQVVADLAADAAVGEAHHVAVDPDDELGVDIDRAEVVDEDSDAQAVIPGQDAIQQRRLSRPEKAGQDRDRNSLAVVVDDFHYVRFPIRSLSQREIGAQLYLSLNTVKTHTRELYRKLGDQSHLYGLLGRIADLGLTLRSVTPLNTDT